MIKKNLKIFAVLFIVLTIISSFSLCFADETTAEGTNVENNNTTETAAENTNETEETKEPEVHNGDLYIFESKVKMDKLVDGNVYIMGNDVEVTGQINGNLFVLGQNVTLGTKNENTENNSESTTSSSNNSCYVRYSIYVCANNVYYNGACNDLYVATRNLEMTYDSYVIRDVKAVSSNTILQAAVGRDVDLMTSNLSFGNDDNKKPIIYGNLRYSANKELEIKEGIVEGEVKYSSHNIAKSNESVGQKVLYTVLEFLGFIVTSVVIYLLLSKFSKKCIDQMSENKNAKYILKTLGVGILTLLAGTIATILLFITSVGSTLGFILASILVFIGLLSTPIATIYIANILKPILKIEKEILFYLVLALITVIIHGITFIPFIGGLVSALVFALGYGIVAKHLLPHKNSSN